MHSRLSFIVVLAALSLWLPVSTAATSADTSVSHFNGGYLVADHEGQTLHQLRPDQLYIPASTVKLITAYLCLQFWGEEHRFTTKFFFDNNTRALWIKAGGDPFIVSEEIELMADALIAQGITRINAIGLDVALFGGDLVVPGAGTTDNPYDAVPTAIGANFNTVYIGKERDEVFSAEPQTPLTPTAMTIGQSLQNGEKKRVNVGRSSARAERYFAELLAQALRKRGAVVNEAVIWGKVPAASPVYEHQSSRTLGQVVQGMLKYSTNFIANQLLLTLVAEQTSAAADFKAARQFLSQTLTEQFGWQSFHLAEGAGLSSDNRLSANHLVEVVERFAPWRHLLPEMASGVFAKTGTLTGVKTLAGYIADRNGGWRTFAVLVNQPVAPDWPLQLIQSLNK